MLSETTPEHLATVTGITWRMNAKGRAIPSVHFEPEFQFDKDTVISSVSGVDYFRMTAHRTGVHAYVKIGHDEQSGMVRVKEVMQGSDEIVAPAVCPNCLSVLELSQDALDLECHNVRCSGRSVSQVFRFFDFVQSLDAPHKQHNILDSTILKYVNRFPTNLSEVTTVDDLFSFLVSFSPVRSVDTNSRFESLKSAIDLPDIQLAWLQNFEVKMRYVMTVRGMTSKEIWTTFFPMFALDNLEVEMLNCVHVVNAESGYLNNLVRAKMLTFETAVQVGKLVPTLRAIIKYVKVKE